MDISSDSVPLAIAYIPSMVFGAILVAVDPVAEKVPPLSLVSKRLLSVMVTLPSLSIGRNINISPTFVCM